MQQKPPKRLQIVLLATGAFAVPSMRMLYESGRYDLVCLVTNPLRYDKTGRPILTPARRFAHEFGIPISDMEDVHSREFSDFLYLVRPDLLFVCDFGQILSKQVLKGAILGGINLHGSLLPKYRGAAPVHWAILSGETYTGVSIIHMTPQVDAGPVIAQSPPIPIGSHETVPELEERLAEFGARIVFDTIEKMAGDEQVRIIEQIHKMSSKAPRFKKEHGWIDWTRSSHDIFNHYRAMAEWPKSFTRWFREDESELRLILGPMLPLDDSFSELIEDDFSGPAFVPPVLIDAKMNNLASIRAGDDDGFGFDTQNRSKKTGKRKRPGWWKPGVVVRAGNGELILAAGEGTVRILKLQPAGRKMMDVDDFLRGNPVKPGDRFG